MSSRSRNLKIEARATVDGTERHEQYLRLWARHERDVRRYVMTLVPRAADADDVLQETAVALWRKFDEYDPQRPFIKWACRFAYLEVMKQSERAARDKRQFCDAVVRILDIEQQETQDLLEKQRTALRECLNQLDQQDRKLVEIRYRRQGGVVAHASKTGTPAKRLYGALERIRRALIECVNRKLAVEG